MIPIWCNNRYCLINLVEKWLKKLFSPNKTRFRSFMLFHEKCCLKVFNPDHFVVFNLDPSSLITPDLISKLILDLSLLPDKNFWSMRTEAITAQTRIIEKYNC